MSKLQLIFANDGSEMRGVDMLKAADVGEAPAANS